MVCEVRGIFGLIYFPSYCFAEKNFRFRLGEGAKRFADYWGVERVTDDYFITDERRRQWEQARKNRRIGLDHDGPELQQPMVEEKFGTAGAVAWDARGHLAGATSTGGMVNKRLGRVGDSPIIGSGVYADDETCAISCTGFGEDFMRTVLAKTVSDILLFQGGDARTAVDRGIEYLERKVQRPGRFDLHRQTRTLCLWFHHQEDDPRLDRVWRPNRVPILTGP